MRHGHITVWPQGRVTAAMCATYGDFARFWSKQVWLVAEVPMEVRIFDNDAAAEVDEWRMDPKPFLPQAAVTYAVAARLAKALALTLPRVRALTYQDFAAADREQAARSEQVSALELTLGGMIVGSTNSEYNPLAFPTFTEWDMVKAAVDPMLERTRPKEPELVSVDDLPWYPIQPICVKKRLCDQEHRDLEKLVEQRFCSVSGPQNKGGPETFNVRDTLSLLYILLTGEIPSKEVEMVLHLYGLPARHIAFAVNQLVTGKDSWTEQKRCCLAERTFLWLLCNLQRLAYTSPVALFPHNKSKKLRATMENHCCNVMYRAMGNQHFLHTGFVPEVVRAGLDLIPSDYAHPSVVLPSISELMARRAAEKGYGNR